MYLDKMLIRSILVWLIVVLSYHIMGGEKFPDYHNYVYLSESGGYLNSDNEYFAEWIARWWLREVGVFLGDHHLSITLLTMAVQSIYFFWLLANSKNNDSNVAKFWITVILGPLLLTTTLRATIAYIIIYQLFMRKGEWIYIFSLAILALSFHDSSLIPILALSIGIFFWRVSHRKVYAIIAFVLSILLVFNFFGINAGLMLGDFDFGIRSSYVDSEFGGITKNIFAAIVVAFSVYTALHDDCDYIFISVLFMVFGCSLVFSVAPVAGVRLYFYCVGVSFILVARSRIRIPRLIMNNDAIINCVAPMALIIFLYDVLRNTNE